MYEEGYYWCYEPDTSFFVALRSEGCWFVPGNGRPVDIASTAILGQIATPDDVYTSAPATLQ
jgi:hypothetical protein